MTISCQGAKAALLSSICGRLLPVWQWAQLVMAEKNAQSLPTDQRLRIQTEKPVRPAIFSLRATLS
jgi:hypothetical protein